MLLSLYFGRQRLTEIEKELFNKMHVSNCSFNVKSVPELEDWMSFSYGDSYRDEVLKDSQVGYLCRTFEEVCSVPLKASKHPIV